MSSSENVEKMSEVSSDSFRLKFLRTESFEKLLSSWFGVCYRYEIILNRVLSEVVA